VGFDIRVPQDLLHSFGRHLAVGQCGAQPVPECVQLHILRRQNQLSQQWLQTELHHVLPLTRAAIPVWKQKPTGISCHTLRK
jgi:hypothetical protein